MPLSRSRSPERDYVVRCLAEAKARPSLGELPALLEKGRHADRRLPPCRRPRALGVRSTDNPDSRRSTPPHGIPFDAPVHSHDICLQIETSL
jgi:hypothetical protein